MQSTPKKNITLKTIATAANCSTAVVSTVLNGSRGNTKVSEQMRKQVLEVAKALDYRPNFASRSLKSNRSNTLGIYVQPKQWRQLSNSYEMMIFRGIEQAARECNYDLLVLNISSQNLPKICADRIREKRIDGVLLIHCDPDAEWIRQLLDVSSNVVQFDTVSYDERLNTINFDNQAAIHMAVDHLTSLGHTRIGYVSSCLPTPESDISLRETSFRELVQDHPELETIIFNRDNCPISLTLSDHFCQAEGREAIRYFRQLTNPPTAIITYNSLVGLSLFREAKQLGIAIPEQLSLISIEKYPDFGDEQLSVIDHPLTEMGYAGTELLVQHLQSTTVLPPFQKVFQPTLLPGATTAPLLKR